MSDLNFDVSRLGECTIPSPMSKAPFVDEKERVIYHTNVSEINSFLDKGMQLPSLEVAGPREKIFFDPVGTQVRYCYLRWLVPGSQ